MVAKENPQLASNLVNGLLDSLKQIFVNDQDAFKSKNVFRFLGSLVDLRVVSANCASQFILKILDEGLKAGESFQRDLVLQCVLTFLTTECASERLQNESGADFGKIVGVLNE